MADHEKAEDATTQDARAQDAKAQDVEELRESAEAMGVEDADRKDADELVEDARHAQTDSESSPSGWKAEREEG